MIFIAAAVFITTLWQGLAIFTDF